MKKEKDYDIKIGIDKIEFFDNSIREIFMNDFDDKYYSFLKEMGELLFKWKVKEINTYVCDSDLKAYLFDREF